MLEINAQWKVVSLHVFSLKLLKRFKSKFCKRSQYRKLQGEFNFDPWWSKCNGFFTWSSDQILSIS